MTIDNSVRYVNKHSHMHSEQTPPISRERKKNTSDNKLSENNKKFLKIISGEGFRKHN